MSLSGQRFGQHFVVTAYKHLVNKVDACYPVSVLHLPVTVLNVVLTTGKVPHEISPVHEIDLISQEELYVICLCRHDHFNIVSTLVICGGTALYASTPGLVLGNMF